MMVGDVLVCHQIKSALGLICDFWTFVLIVDKMTLLKEMTHLP